jgi:hypothetical protein
MILTNNPLNLIFQVVLHPVVVDLIHQLHLMKLKKMVNQEKQRQSQKDSAQGRQEDQRDHIPNQNGPDAQRRGHNKA